MNQHSNPQQPDPQQPKDSSPYRAPNSQVSNQPEVVYLPRTRLQKAMPLSIIGAGVLQFVFVHLIAGNSDDLLSGQFLIGAPFFVGAFISYLHNYYSPATLMGISESIILTILIIALISAPILREGAICIVMASPILFIAMWLGAYIMNVICRYIWKSKVMHSIALLPFLVLGVPLPETDTTYESHASIIIDAKPEAIWQQLNHITAISNDEFYQNSWLMPFMQVPAPKSAVTVLENGQWVRKCEWHKGIYFDEPIVAQIPNRHLRWQFVFYDDSVPKGALDDHVTINGEHFKLLWGQYDITPINAHQSQLSFKVSYRVTTNINFYAGRWANKVMNDFNEDVLTLYKNRLERLPI